MLYLNYPVEYLAMFLFIRFKERVKFLGDKDDFGSKIYKGDFRKCDLSGSEFCVESIAKAKFIKANLDGATFIYWKLQSVILGGHHVLKLI